MSAFHVQLGRDDQRAGRHSVPIGLSGEPLEDWKKGHGAGWTLRSASPVREMESSTNRDSTGSHGGHFAAPVASAPDCPVQSPYAPFSTPATKRRSKTTVQTRSSKLSSGKPSCNVKHCSLKRSPQQEVRSPKPVMGLFGPLDDEITNTKTPLKNPNPIPDVDRDAERLALQRIGISPSAAVTLIANDWTLDQLECRWQLNDWSNHPQFVQDVQGLVTAHCEQSWPTQKPKDKEVCHAGALTENE